MEMRQLEIFRALAEELHFTRAAQRVHCVQSNVTTQIRALEEELGTRLFDRLAKRVILTEAGRRFLPSQKKFSPRSTPRRPQSRKTPLLAVASAWALLSLSSTTACPKSSAAIASSIPKSNSPSCRIGTLASCNPLKPAGWTWPSG